MHSSLGGKEMPAIEFNKKTLDNLQLIIKSCFQKGLEVKIGSQFHDAEETCLTIYDMGHHVCGNTIDAWFEKDHEALAHEAWFADTYIPFKEERDYFDIGLVKGGYYDLLVDYSHYTPHESEFMWRCKCIGGVLHASDASGRTWEIKSWTSVAIRPHQALTGRRLNGCSSLAFKDEIRTGMAFMELVEVCIMSQSRSEQREGGSGFGVSSESSARKLKNKTNDGSTVFVFINALSGSVHCRIGKYFDHPELGSRWDDTHSGTFYEQAYLLDILSRIE